MDLLDYIPDTNDLVVELKPKDKVLLNEDKTPMTITFYGPYSEEAKKVKHSMIDERIAKSQKDSKTAFSSKEVEELNIISLARNIKEWNITFNKKQPKLTEAVAIELLTKAFWIRDLYEKAAENTLGFMKD